MPFGEVMRPAASTSARCENACGKFPEVPAGVDVEFLGVKVQRRRHLDQAGHQIRARCISPMIASAETSQKEQITNVPSLPDRPSSVSPVR